MIIQYQVLTRFLEQIKASCSESDTRLRLEFLIYRLKLLLLRSEKLSKNQIDTLCPPAELELIQEILNDAGRALWRNGAAQRVEEGLRRVIRRMEPCMDNYRNDLERIYLHE